MRKRCERIWIYCSEHCFPKERNVLAMENFMRLDTQLTASDGSWLREN